MSNVDKSNKLLIISYGIMVVLILGLYTSVMMKNLVAYTISGIAILLHWCIGMDYIDGMVDTWKKR